MQRACKDCALKPSSDAGANALKSSSSRRCKLRARNSTSRRRRSRARMRAAPSHKYKDTNGVVMKSVFTKSMRLSGLLILVMAAASFTAQAQGVRLNLDNLKQLEAKSAESVDVSLDGSLLELAKNFLDVKKPKQAQIKDAISGIRGIYVRAFEFAKEGTYTPSDVDSVREQVRGS